MVSNDQATSRSAGSDESDNMAEASTERPSGSPRGRARRRHRSSEERKDQIIRAAQEAFSRTSLHGASTRQIARAADVNPATLFEHFGSKEALFREAVVAPLLKEIKQLKVRVGLYQSSKSPETDDEIARSGIQKQLDAMTKIFPLLTTALFSDLETGKMLYQEHIVPLIEERTEMVKGLAPKETDLYFLELATIGLLFAVVMDETFAGPRLSRPALADQLLRLILAGTSHQVHSNVSTEASLADRQLHHLRQVGNSELMVSPLGLGKIGSGPFRKSSTRDDLKDVFELYTSLGGNFVEVENASDDCSFHDLVAEFVKDRRQELVVSLNLNLFSGREMLDPVRTFRQRLMQSVEDNLLRLGTDVVDLLYVGKFDPRLPLEEVLGACDDLVEEGKIRFVGMSDVPAWQAARLLTLAEVRGSPRIVTLRVPYGLTVREPETDQLPLAQEMGLGVTSWAPFTGDYLPAHPASGENAEGHAGAGSFVSFSEPGIRSILNTIESIARELGRTPAQVALAWKFVHPTIASLLVYPTNVDQLDEFLIALQIVFSDDQLRRLDSVSRMIASPTQRIEASLSG